MGLDVGSSQLVLPQRWQRQAEHRRLNPSQVRTLSEYQMNSLATFRSASRLHCAIRCQTLGSEKEDAFTYVWTPPRSRLRRYFRLGRDGRNLGYRPARCNRFVSRSGADPVWIRRVSPPRLLRSVASSLHAQRRAWRGWIRQLSQIS